MSRTLNIAHRGARSLAPENTLAAAQKALDVGADMWELDVSVTGDGHLIVLHDDTLTRTTNVEDIFPKRAPWRVQDFSLAEIKRLETDSAFIQNDPFEQIAAGAISTAELDTLRGEPIPTLREALEFTRAHNWRVNVEIKPLLPPLHTFPIAQKVTELIAELQMIEQTLVSSFVPLYLKQTRQLNPTLATAVLTQGPLSLAERLGYRQNGIDEITPLHYFEGAEPQPFLASLGSHTYHPRYRIVSPEKITAWQQAGLSVNVWTVNNRAHMARLVKAGVDGIVTDYPQVLREVLSST